jgi:hypothetical protein
MTRFYSTLLAAALVVCLAVPASGQISFGVKAGANFASLGGDDVPSDWGSRTGLVVGGLMTYSFTDMLALRPEVLYSQKGASFTESGVDVDFKADYLEVPVLLLVNVPMGANELRPTLHVGPSFGFEVGCKISGSDGGTSVDVDCDDMGLDERRKLDLGLGLGGGLDIAFGAGTLMIEGRYTLGLQTLDTSSDPGDIKNRAFSITFGYRF